MKKILHRELSGIVLDLSSLLEVTDPQYTDTKEFQMVSVKNKHGKRETVRLGKYLTALTCRNSLISHTVLCLLTEKLSVELWRDLLQIRLDSGQAIADNYYYNVGGKSCLTGRKTVVGLYVNNPSTHQQLVMVLGKWSARAMVVKLENGDYLLDRIYSNCNSCVLKDEMIAYANSQGWVISYRNLSGSNCLKNGRIYNCGDLITDPLVFKAGQVPFQDTLKFGHTENGKLILSYDRGYLPIKFSSGFRTIKKHIMCCKTERNADGVCPKCGNKWTETKNL